MSDEQRKQFTEYEQGLRQESERTMNALKLVLEGARGELLRATEHLCTAQLIEQIAREKWLRSKRELATALGREFPEVQS